MAEDGEEGLGVEGCGVEGLSLRVSVLELGVWGSGEAYIYMEPHMGFQLMLRSKPTYYVLSSSSAGDTVVVLRVGFGYSVLGTTRPQFGAQLRFGFEVL